MSIKFNLVNHFMGLGYSKPFAIKMAENHDREASKPLAKPSAEVIARCNLQKRANHPIDFMQKKGFLL